MTNIIMLASFCLDSGVLMHVRTALHVFLLVVLHVHLSALFVGVALSLKALARHI